MELQPLRVAPPGSEPDGLMPLPFTPSPSMTLGVEMELQLISADSLDLTPAAPRLLEILGDERHVKPEIFQSMIEINTGICANAAQAHDDLIEVLGRVQRAGDAGGILLASAGSHPFARHRDRLMFPAERYAMLMDRRRWVARRLMIFGLHVHVGMRSGEHAVELLNGALPYLPIALALSASSPFWQGDDTGMASSRATVFEALPTGGHPCTYPTWAAFERLHDAMLASGAITSIKDLWWDIRPHPELGTVEVRICDSLPSVRETTAMAALLHALFAWLDARSDGGERFPPQAEWIMRENKWRAARGGLDESFVVDDTGRCEPGRALLDRLLATLEPIAARQGAAGRFADLACMAELPSYVRQRRVFEREGSCEAVARSLVHEFRAGIGDERPIGAGPVRPG